MKHKLLIFSLLLLASTLTIAQLKPRYPTNVRYIGGGYINATPYFNSLKSALNDVKAKATTINPYVFQLDSDSMYVADWDSVYSGATLRMVDSIKTYYVATGKIKWSGLLVHSDINTYAFVKTDATTQTIAGNKTFSGMLDFGTNVASATLRMPSKSGNTYLSPNMGSILFDFMGNAIEYRGATGIDTVATRAYARLHGSGGTGLVDTTKNYNWLGYHRYYGDIKFYKDIFFGSYSHFYLPIRDTALAYSFYSDGTELYFRNSSGIKQTLGRLGGSNVWTGSGNYFVNHILLGQTNTVNGKVDFYNSSNSYMTSLTAPSATGDKTIMLPNRSGTLALADSLIGEANYIWKLPQRNKPTITSGKYQFWADQDLLNSNDAILVLGRTDIDKDTIISRKYFREHGIGSTDSSKYVTIGMKGGVTNQLLYQTSASHTGFVAVPADSNKVLYGNLKWKATGTGVTSLNTLTSNIQTFATATTGTDFTISSDPATNIHTFAIPDASGTARGLITTGAQTIAGAKTFSSAPNLSSLTVSQLLALDGSGNIQSLAVATYPSLTEMTYVKGLTSSAQTQLTSKAATNQTMYIGTTSVPINRGSAALALTGITSIDGNAATVTNGVYTSSANIFTNTNSIYGALKLGSPFGSATPQLGALWFYESASIFRSIFATNGLTQNRYVTVPNADGTIVLNSSDNTMTGKNTYSGDIIYTRTNITSIISNTIDATGKTYISVNVSGVPQINTINGGVDGKIIYITILGDDTIFGTGVGTNIADVSTVNFTVGNYGTVALIYNSAISRWMAVKY